MKNRIFSIMLAMALLLIFTGGTVLAQNKTEQKDLNTGKKYEQIKPVHVTAANKSVKTTKDIQNVKEENKNQKENGVEVKGTDTKKNEMKNMSKETQKMMNDQKHNQQHVSTTKEKEKEIKTSAKQNAKK